MRAQAMKPENLKLTPGLLKTRPDLWIPRDDFRVYVGL